MGVFSYIFCVKEPFPLISKKGYGSISKKHLGSKKRCFFEIEPRCFFEIEPGCFFEIEIDRLFVQKKGLFSFLKNLFEKEKNKKAFGEGGSKDTVRCFWKMFNFKKTSMFKKRTWLISKKCPCSKKGRFFEIEIRCGSKKGCFFEIEIVHGRFFKIEQRCFFESRF